jgi:Peptidase C65 Otubain
VALQVSITVVYLDNSGKPPPADVAEVPCDSHEFTPSDDGADVSSMPRVTALYRPGHYDILYHH